MKNKIFPLVLLLILTTSPVFAELKKENLLHGMPDGYKVGHQSRKGNNLIVEMVPANETVQNWTEMLTVNITFGNLPVTPVKYSELMKDMWGKSCPDSGGSMIASGKENGYPFAVWILSCQHNPSSGKPEWTLFKAIKGNDSFYVVQKAWRREPTKNKIKDWMQHLRKVKVCDSRLPDRKCPVFK